MWNDAAKAVMLDAILRGTDPATGFVQFASLHTSYDAAGGNEVSGGTPAYARKAIAFSANSAGASDSSTNPTFDVPASTTVAFKGLWSAVTGGTFYGMFPLGGASANNPFPFAGESTDDVITTMEDHGFSDTDTVVVFGPNLPTGITEGTIYFVRDSTARTFKLAATSGGTAITLSADGVGIVQAITTETFASQGTFEVSDSDYSANLLT